MRKPLKEEAEDAEDRFVRFLYSWKKGLHSGPLLHAELSFLRLLRFQL